MQTVTTIGLDIAKSVFQVHGVDAAGQVVIRRQLKRRYVLAFFQKLRELRRPDGKNAAYWRALAGHRHRSRCAPRRCSTSLIGLALDERE